MVREFLTVTGGDRQPDDLITHRWLYAKSSDRAKPGHLWFADEKIGLVGDWLDGGRVEGAFNSAHSLVNTLVSLKA
jgi:predicted NAD/FAD-dependent oxidoreductase